MKCRSLLSIALLLTVVAAPVMALVPPLPPSRPGSRLPPTAEGRPPFKAGQILVRLTPGASETAFLGDTGLTVADRVEALRTLVLAVPEGQEAGVAEALSRRPDVAYAELNRMRYILRTPNDPGYASYQWHLPYIHAPEAWNTSTGSASITVAVLDTGADIDHPDLKNKLVPGYNTFTRATSLNATDDDEGHGTHVSGLVGADSNNGLFTTGVSWGAKVMPVKILDKTGAGDDAGIARGITYAADHGANILNMSFGAEGYTQTLFNAIVYAKNKGCQLVAAAGNEGATYNLKDYPAAFSQVMAVGASTDVDTRAYYSQMQEYVSVVAPGGSATSNTDSNTRHWILSLFPLNIDPSGVQWMAGTSQASPVVAGLAALLWGVKPDLTADDIQKTIEQSAVDIAPAGRDIFTGYGRVDALAAMNRLISNGDVTPPGVSITFPAPGAYLSGSVAIRGSVEDAALQSYQVEYGSGRTPTYWNSIGAVMAQSVHLGQLALWNTDAVPGGVYSLRVRATDTAGNTTDSSQATPLVVTVDHSPPVITLSQPTEGQTVSRGSSVVGTITDDALQNYRVELGVGAAPTDWTDVADGTTAAPLETILGSLNLNGQAAGPYAVRVTATDKAGNVSQTVVHIAYQPYGPGDVTHDGVVNIADAQHLLRMTIGLEAEDLDLGDVAPSPGDFSNGRSYGDGRITILDVVRLLRDVAGFEPNWPF